MRRLKVTLLLFLTCIAVTRCDDDDHEESIVEDSTVWRWDPDRTEEYDEEHYFWNTTLQEAWVIFRVSPAVRLISKFTSWAVAFSTRPSIRFGATALLD